MKHTDDGYTGKSGFKGHDSMRENAERMFRENMKGPNEMSTATSTHGPMRGQEGGMKKGGHVKGDHVMHMSGKGHKKHELENERGLKVKMVKMAAGGSAKIRHGQATKEGSPMSARLAKSGSKSDMFCKSITKMSKVK